MTVKNKPKKRVLIGSPVHQKPAVLREFLISLQNLRHHHLEFGYFFIDDNLEELASAMLRDFAKHVGNVTLETSRQEDMYVRNEVTHHWNEDLIWKVAEFKNVMLRRALNEKYDYLFLVDSDVLLHPRTVEQLVSSGKDIVSEIFGLLGSRMLLRCLKFGFAMSIRSGNNNEVRS